MTLPVDFASREFSATLLPQSSACRDCDAERPLTLTPLSSPRGDRLPTP
jgi:hypothetical protein